MTKTLPLQHLISDDSQYQYSYNVLECQFGEGYEQIAQNGQNNESIIWSVNYKNLTPEYFNQLMKFLRGLKGADPLFATIPGESKKKTWRLVKDSLSVSTTAISRFDQTRIIRSISFQLKSTNAITSN